MTAGGDVTTQVPGRDVEAELAFWRTLAEERGKVIQALHEFNYWHGSTVARGEVIAGLERGLEQWRERCLAAEANQPAPTVDEGTLAVPPRTDADDVPASVMVRTLWRRAVARVPRRGR